MFEFEAGGNDDEEIELDLSGLGGVGIFQSIVRRCKGPSAVVITSAWTCTKMRPDGFGGGVPNLMAAIAADDAGADWEGEPVTLDRVDAGETLVLVGTEVAWGIFEKIEGFARRAALVYARWSGGASGSFGPERVVFSGAGEPEHFSASDDDEVMLSAPVIRQLGSHAAILASFERAELSIPPLIVRG